MCAVIYFLPAGVPRAGCGNPSFASHFGDDKLIPDFWSGGS